MQDGSPSESLSNAEEEIKTLRGLGMRQCCGNAYSKYRWIQVVAKVYTHRPNGSAVSQPGADRVGNIIEVALIVCSEGKGAAIGGVLLRKADQARQNIAACAEHIPSVMEEHRASVLFHDLQGDGRS